ncbi:RHS repeat-associated core domain-containing protein [Pleionea sp. CnH1-48]|uniref:RHS repeat-associated core domain-containing protein n=1 Tax=Pleionea sp. CnH1-48 TaxID=2954494 RepID=UPI002097A9AC|nr:RHS repeat-associated core domain-containing protein [Pleionea sp. CnH1-48]MCO7227522.1 hypothetical protein [Pleionea sp. CnH1-48]
MNIVNQITTYLLVCLLAVISQAVSAEKVTYYFNDLSGSPVQAFDQNGNEVWHEQYTPYGRKLIKPAQNNNDVGFTGHQSDDDIGLTYMQARYYDAEIGRFYSIDPVDFRLDNLQSFNRYAYANNNPYKYVDPDGRVPVLVPLVVFLAKELASEAVEQTTGIPMPTLKNAGKFAFKGTAKAVRSALVEQQAKRIKQEVKQQTKSQYKVTSEKVSSAHRGGRQGKQKRLREMMDDPKVSSADRGWLKNDKRHIEYGNKSGLRLPRNGRKSPGRKQEDKGYELAHPHDRPASQGNGYAGSKLKNHADHKVETRLHNHRY